MQMSWASEDGLQVALYKEAFENHCAWSTRGHWKSTPLLNPAVKDKDWKRLWKGQLDLCEGVLVVNSKTYRQKITAPREGPLAWESERILEWHESGPNRTVLVLDPEVAGQDPNSLSSILAAQLPVVNADNWMNRNIDF